MTDANEQLAAEHAVAKAALDNAYRAVFATEAGKRVLFHILAEGGIYQDAFTGSDAATNYTLGRKRQALDLLGDLNGIDERLYPQLLLAMADIREMDRAIAAKQSAQQETEDE